MLIALDPGRSGGQCAMSDTLVVASKLVYKNKMVDVMALADFVQEHSPSVAVVERQWGRGMQGASSSSMMLNYGRILATLEIMEVPYITPTPSSWQKITIPGPSGKTKERSIEFATANYPDISLLPTPRCKKMSDGISDALCIAHTALYNWDELTKNL